MKSTHFKKIISTVVVITLTIIGTYYVTYRSPEVAAKKLVVVLHPTEYTTVDRMCLGIEEAWATSKYAGDVVIRKFGFDVFDKIRTLATVETVFEQKPDVIVAIGGTAAIALNETMKKRSIEVPVVFAGVTVAVEWGLIESYEHPGGMMTGVDSVGEIGSNIQAKLLCIAKPTVKKVLIPFTVSTDPRDKRAEGMAESMKNYLEGRGIEVTALPLASSYNALDKIAAVLPGHDTLCSLEIDASAHLNGGFSKLCAEMGVTFFCGIIDGINLEAALSFGLDPKPIGGHLFTLATDILFHGKHPSTMPIVVLTLYRELYINVIAGLSQEYKPHFPQIVRDLAADPEVAPILKRMHVVNTHSRHETAQ